MKYARFHYYSNAAEAEINFLENLNKLGKLPKPQKLGSILVYKSASKIKV
jgi:hypothetical protein